MERLTKTFIEDSILKEKILDNFKVEQFLSVGDNAAGCLIFVSAQNLKNEPLDFVFKTFPPNLHEFSHIRTNQVFRIETAIYNGVAPALHKILENKNSPLKLPIPKFYAGFNDDVSDFLAVENLRVSNFKMHDKFQGLNNNQTGGVMKKIAQFHALTYFYIRHEGEKVFDDPKISLIANSNWSYKKIDWELTEKIFGGGVELAINFIEKFDKDLGEKVRSKVGDGRNAAKIIKSVSLGTDVKYFPVILHGDLWTNNIMIKSEANGEVTDVKFIDFQLSRKGAIFEDLHYFFLTSTSVEDRKNYMSDWLNIYYDAFISTLNSINFPPPYGFTRGFLFDEMTNSYMHGFLYMAFAIPFQYGNHEDDEAEEEKKLKNPPGTMDEIYSDFNNYLKRWMEKSERAQKRLYEIASECNELGYLD